MNGESYGFSIGVVSCSLGDTCDQLAQLRFVREVRLLKIAGRVPYVAGFGFGERGDGDKWGASKEGGGRLEVGGTRAMCIARTAERPQD